MAENTALMELKQWVDDNYPNFNKADIEAKIDEILPKERKDNKKSYEQGYSDCNHLLDPMFDNYFTNTFNHQ